MKIKICGLTLVKEAEYLNDNNVDYAGMVLFFNKSKRCISLSKAKEIIEALNPDIKKVAVVVSPTIEQAVEIEQTGFDIIQIHGNLPNNLSNHISIPIWKAFNVNDLSKFDLYNGNPAITGYVFDAVRPGSGQTFDWKLIDNIPRTEKMFILAGGLCHDNVQEAIQNIKPDCVDVSSGVESDLKAGKDKSKIDLFVKAVRK